MLTPGWMKRECSIIGHVTFYHSCEQRILGGKRPTRECLAPSCYYMIKGAYPSQWKVEYVTPIAKIEPPQSEDDLRNIALTAFFSRVFVGIVAGWLFKYIKSEINPGQYGGLPGNSISHYVVELINVVLYNLDLPIPHAVLLAMIDFSKAFD